jgi:hypothetical protein
MPGLPAPTTSQAAEHIPLDNALAEGHSWSNRTDCALR